MSRSVGLREEQELGKQLAIKIASLFPRVRSEHQHCIFYRCEV
jgi:hypothetical protein